MILNYLGLPIIDHPVSNFALLCMVYIVNIHTRIILKVPHLKTVKLLSKRLVRSFSTMCLTRVIVLIIIILFFYSLRWVYIPSQKFLNYSRFDETIDATIYYIYRVPSPS